MNLKERKKKKKKDTKKYECYGKLQTMGNII